MESFVTRFKNVLVLVAILLAQTIGLAVQVRRPVDPGAPDGYQPSPFSATGQSRQSPRLSGSSTALATTFATAGRTTSTCAIPASKTATFRRRSPVSASHYRGRPRSPRDAIQGPSPPGSPIFSSTTSPPLPAIFRAGHRHQRSDLSRALYRQGNKRRYQADRGRHHARRHHRQAPRRLPPYRPGTSHQRSDLRCRSCPGHYASPCHPSRQHYRPDSDHQSNPRLPHQVRRAGSHLGRRSSLPSRSSRRHNRVHQKRSRGPSASRQFSFSSSLQCQPKPAPRAVLIITGTQPTLPLPAQHDLAVGAATAEAQAAAAKQLAEQQAAEAAAKSAAQIVADRLPSLHDPDHPDTNQPAPGTPGAPVPGGVVPKPLPTVHPDRYTSGSTPSAADLKPGAAERNNPTTITPPPTTTNQPQTTDQPATTKPRKPQPQTDAAQPPNPQP